MAELIWSEQAVFDVETTLQRVERTSPAYSQALGDEIREVIASIKTFPLLGAEVPEYRTPDIRERQVRNWRLIYRVDGETVELPTFVDVSRQLPRTPPG